MAEPDTAINLAALIAAQIAAINTGVAGITAVAYDADRREFALPACMIRIADFERDDEGDIGTEQLALRARFEAHVIVGHRSAAAVTAAPSLALAVAQAIERNRFGLPVSPAQVAVVEPDDFAPEMDQFVVWRVDYAQVIHVGASIWDNDGTLPTQVLSSWAPDTGPDHEGDYTPVVDEPDE